MHAFIVDRLSGSFQEELDSIVLNISDLAPVLLPWQLTMNAHKVNALGELIFSKLHILVAAGTKRIHSIKELIRLLASLDDLIGILKVNVRNRMRT